MILSRLLVSHSFRLPENAAPKTLVLILATTFSGSLWAADWHTQEGAFCHTPSQETHAVAPAQGSGGERLAKDVTRITADRMAGQIQARHRAEGDVIVERNQETLNADWIDYDQPSDTVRAGDEFTLTRANGQTVRGKTLDYQLDSSSGSVQNAQFEAQDKDGRRLQGVSSELQMHDKQHYEMRDVQFNTCQPGDKSWYIQAAEVKTNHETGIGVAKHARLVFGGVPVLYTPWADFPINGNRKSGLLVPSISIGSDGTKVDLPYYLNLAPNYDATITPSVITARGARIGGEFRYLEPKFSGSLSGMYMPDDKRSQFNNRYEINAQHHHRLSEHLSGGISYHQVSDDDYYRDFYGRNDIAENVNLDRRLWLNYQKDVWGQPFTAQLLVQKYQTLSDALGNKDRPYAIMPRLSAQWQKNFSQTGQFNISGQFTHFSHDTKQEGARAVIYPSVQWDFHNHWGYVRPKIGLHATQYWLDAFENQGSRNVSRVLPIVNVESGMTFERQARLFGNQYMQTLEPRLFYNYIPKKSQNDLPNFDTSENDFSYEQLFRENAYSGNDRINASNSVALGLQTRILDHKAGAERFRAGIGQRFYLNNDNVSLDGRVYKGERNRSDLVAFAGGWLHPNWYADTRWHWSQSDEETKNFDVGMRYNPEPGKVLAARFKYGANEEIYTGFYGKLKHIDLAAQWPINQNLYAVGRLNYSISPWVALEQTAGLEYRNPCGCWGVSVIGQRYVDGLNSHKNAFFVTLQLKDLSNIGNNPYEQLRLGIPGYTKTNEVFTQ
ncbi:LPS-assembly protein LptD [Neisseriaceae bacterium B1]